MADTTLIRGGWDAALAALTAARAIDDEVTARYDAACNASSEGEAPEELAQEWERAIDASHHAVWAMMAIPSPDHAALLWKTEYLFGRPIPEGECSASWSRKVMDEYLADARRLLGGEG